MDLPALSSLLINLGSPHQYFVQWISDKVFHYTDLDALQNIVTGQDLWLMDSRFSNDSAEIEYGFLIAQKVIRRRLRRRKTGKAEKKLLRDLRGRLEKTKEQGVYVSCFCTSDDLLGQWRSYGANGIGVSVGLGTSGFEFIAGPDMPPGEFGLLYLWRVFYDPEQQERIVDDCLDIVQQGTQPPKSKVELADNAVRMFIPTFKNRHFEAEKEARLVFIPSESCVVKPDFRVARGMLVPYYSLRKLAVAANRGDWRLPVVSVCVGPSVNRDMNKRSVELLVRAQQYPDAEIIVSDTPYRG